MSPVTISVSKVDRANQPAKKLDREASVRKMLHRRVEALSSGSLPLISCTDVHPLAEAASLAFYQHYPLSLSPDAIWFCLAQGFAQHVNLNAERLRRHFVRHEGKVKLVVDRPDFLLGKPNPWPEAFAAFSEQIAAHVGRLRDLIVADFSTTGPIERAASEVVLMDAFQPYFEYEMMIGCGIPSITLLGTPEDWRSIRRRAELLAEFELKEWIRALLPVLDQFVQAAEGKCDSDFWRSFFRYQSGSGPAELTGWIHVLFPYLRDFHKDRQGNQLMPNPYLPRWAKGFQKADSRKGWLKWDEVQGPGINALPAGIASAPVKIIDKRDNSEHKMRFAAGLFGVAQDPSSLALIPEFGWAVLYDE